MGHIITILILLIALAWPIFKDFLFFSLFVIAGVILYGLVGYFYHLLRNRKQIDRTSIEARQATSMTASQISNIAEIPSYPNYLFANLSCTRCNHYFVAYSTNREESAICPKCGYVIHPIWRIGQTKSVQQVRTLRQASSRMTQATSSHRLSYPPTYRQGYKKADTESMTGVEYENHVADYLRGQGFTARLTKASGDFGIDILAERNGQKFAVQVKRQKIPVSRRAVSDAVAGRIHYGCDKAMVVTNTTFTKGAKELAVSTQCELVDRLR